MRQFKDIEELKQWEKENRVFVIRPSQPLQLGHTERNPAKLQAAYDQGLQDAKACLPALMDYLTK